MLKKRRGDYKEERNLKVRKLVLEGKLSLREIGEIFKNNGAPMSRQRVHQIAFGYTKSKSKE